MGCAPRAQVDREGIRQVTLVSLLAPPGMPEEQASVGQLRSSPKNRATSVQAQFLIPMALTLGFGILFATLVLVFIVSCLYLALEGVRRLMSRLSGRILADRQEARA